MTHNPSPLKRDEAAEFEAARGFAQDLDAAYDAVLDPRLTEGTRVRRFRELMGLVELDRHLARRFAQRRRTFLLLALAASDAPKLIARIVMRLAPFKEDELAPYANVLRHVAEHTDVRVRGMPQLIKEVKRLDRKRLSKQRETLRTIR